MRRRDFIAGIAVSTAMPLTARAQQSKQVRRIGVLMNLAPDDPEGQTRLTGFLRGLQESGWADGRNAHIDTLWGTDAGGTRKQAAELVALAPDVILASGSATTSALQQTTRAPCRSYLWLSSIRLVLDTSTAWHAQAATLPGSACSNMASAANG
jgi:putative ABC transport system substrate-binding protein